MRNFSNIFKNKNFYEILYMKYLSFIHIYLIQLFFLTIFIFLKIFTFDISIKINVATFLQYWRISDNSFNYNKFRNV